jgi:hypothetical protein
MHRRQRLHRLSRNGFRQLGGERIQAVDAQVEEAAQPGQGVGVQRRHLRQAEHMHDAAGRGSMEGQLHHLHDVLGQRLEVSSAPLVEAGAAAVRLADDVREDRLLGALQVLRLGAAARQLAVQPELDQLSLPMVFVIANQGAQRSGEMPGAAAALPGEPWPGAAQILAQGRQVRIRLFEQHRQDQQLVGPGVEHFRQGGMRARIDLAEPLPQGGFEPQETHVDEHAQGAGEVQGQPLFEGAVGHDDGRRRQVVAGAELLLQRLGEFLGECEGIGGEQQFTHE